MVNWNEVKFVTVTIYFLQQEKICTAMVIHVNFYVSLAWLNQRKRYLAWASFPKVGKAVYKLITYTVEEHTLQTEPSELCYHITTIWWLIVTPLHLHTPAFPPGSTSLSPFTCLFSPCLNNSSPHPVKICSPSPYVMIFLMSFMLAVTVMCRVTITNNSALTGQPVSITVNLTPKIINLFSDSTA